jgi:hypothetical protein
MNVGRRSVLVSTLLGLFWRDARAGPELRQRPVFASLIQLIATPERFDGALVRVVGFCHLEYEGTVLYLDKESFEAALPHNGVWLDMEWPVPEQYRPLTDTYVMIDGRFSAPKPGSLALHAGRISPIASMIHHPTRAEIEGALRLGRTTQ